MARAQVKQTELLSAIGAAVLGVGIGVLLGPRLQGWGFSLVLAGALAHGVGMYRKHRLEDETRAVWENVLYWTCWILLLALLIALAIQE
jgi:drug/metabolite transporter (DMT)-like permease